VRGGKIYFSEREGGINIDPRPWVVRWILPFVARASFSAELQ
jgi:hypothetical protein